MSGRQSPVQIDREACTIARQSLSMCAGLSSTLRPSMIWAGVMTMAKKSMIVGTVVDEPTPDETSPGAGHNQPAEVTAISALRMSSNKAFSQLESATKDKEGGVQRLAHDIMQCLANERSLGFHIRVTPTDFIPLSQALMDWPDVTESARWYAVHYLEDVFGEQKPPSGRGVKKSDKLLRDQRLHSSRITQVERATKLACVLVTIQVNGGVCGPSYFDDDKGYFAVPVQALCGYGEQPAAGMGLAKKLERGEHVLLDGATHYLSEADKHVPINASVNRIKDAAESRKQSKSVDELHARHKEPSAEPSASSSAGEQVNREALIKNIVIIGDAELPAVALAKIIDKWQADAKKEDGDDVPSWDALTEATQNAMETIEVFIRNLKAEAAMLADKVAAA